MIAPPLLAAIDLSAANPAERVAHLSISFESGLFNLLRGEENSGNHLLLRLLGLLEAPAAGEVLLNGESTAGKTEVARSELRNRHFGFLFSQPFLLPSFSVAENVAMPLFKISGVDSVEARERTNALLDFVGLPSTAATAIARLTLADQHRVALARALINQPQFLIIENLDAILGQKEANEFGPLLRRALSSFGVTIIATAACATGEEDRIIEIADGMIRRDSQPVANRGAAVQ